MRRRLPGRDGLVDQVCCGGACEGTCEACDVSGSEGTCTLHTAGTDPEEECDDDLACDGAGDCHEPQADKEPVGSGGCDCGTGGARSAA
ncbi:MAG: hypothetical protein JRI25_04110 [Deltaproteobacteria bacterium]|nr:hypothetical protein [Deltaproteobacteria bacterium]